MEFVSAYRQLRNGRAIKRPSWKGFIERVLVTPEESVDPFSMSVAYTVGQKVSYGGRAYRCTANTTAGTLPTDTTKWESYTPTPEKYNIVWHKASKTTYTFKYPLTETGSAVNLALDRELIGHITENDWIEGSADDYREALTDDSAVW